jgi:hypothetical protein
MVHLLNTTHAMYSDDETRGLFVDTETRIQVIDTMSMLPSADKEQCAAFIVRAFTFPTATVFSSDQLSREMNAF